MVSSLQQIDDHHEELLNWTTLLDQAIASNKRRSLEPLISFLQHYAIDHFKEEESLMKHHNYIGLALHKAEHKKFTSLINDLSTMYISKKPTAHIIFFIRKILDQLVHHIKTVDSALMELKRNEHY